MNTPFKPNNIFFVTVYIDIFTLINIKHEKPKMLAKHSQTIPLTCKNKPVKPFQTMFKIIHTVLKSKIYEWD